MRKILSISVLTLFCFYFFTSCDKDNNTTPDYSKQTELTKEYAFIQDIYNDIFDLISRATSDTALNLSGNGSIGGAAVTYFQGSNTYLFNFGGTKTNDKNGKFEVNLNGDFQETGTKATVSFIDYKVGNKNVSGSNDITNMGKIVKKTGLSIIYTDSIYNAKITDNSDTVFFNAVYSVEWILNNPLNSNDDQYLFGGYLTANTNSGNTFTAIITSNNRLLVTTSCQWIVSGIINFTTTTLNSNNTPVVTNIIIDFISSDGCNNQISVNIDGTIFNVPL